MQSPVDRRPDQDVTRRDALVRSAAGLALFAGFGSFLSACESTRVSRSGALPNPRWPESPTATRPPTRQPYEPPRPSPGWEAPPAPSGVTSRAVWARGEPIPSRMDPMRPIHRITVHHDGMPPVALTSRDDVARRLEQIRASHLQRNFGDIGYHYVIDPMGGVWQGRPLNWQGAHVARQNEGNMGVLCLGNFEQQHPTSAQINSLNAFVVEQMQRHRVPPSAIYTHRELGPSLCPGRNLQAHMVAARAPRSGALARAF
ncbi:MAG: N-acetylmuramoyl-L-alanine amidase [Phycisphaerales bacterium]|nr:MAG: N-acetylmuramoyl-L-alanine amidase [Phycisphaerales bacterium]